MGPQRYRQRGGEPEEARAQAGPSREAQARAWWEGGALARHLQLCLASLPHPSLERPGEPVVSTVSPLVSRAPGIPWGLVSKEWSLPTPPGTEPCPQV